MVLKAAVIGTGMMGKNHVRNYFEIPLVELCAICDVDEVSGKELSLKFKCNFYKDYNEMIEKEKLDIVSIVVPTSLHKKVACDVLKKGVNVLLEKPISGTVEDALEIINIAKENNVKLAIGHIERFNPAVIKLKEFISNGRLGEITSIHAKRVGLYPSRIKDANIVVDLSVHDIDIFCYLLSMQPDSLHASGGIALNSSREDYVDILLKFGKTSGVINTNWITPIKIRNLSVTGTKGYAELNYITQELTLYESNYTKDADSFGDFLVKFGKPNKVEVGVLNDEPLKLEILDFIEAVSNHREPLVSGTDGLNALKIALDVVHQIKNN